MFRRGLDTEVVQDWRVVEILNCCDQRISRREGVRSFYMLLLSCCLEILKLEEPSDTEPESRESSILCQKCFREARQTEQCRFSLHAFSETQGQQPVIRCPLRLTSPPM